MTLSNELWKYFAFMSFMYQTWENLLVIVFKNLQIRVMLYQSDSNIVLLQRICAIKILACCSDVRHTRHVHHHLFFDLGQSIKEKFNPSNLNSYTSLFPTTPY